MNRREFVIASTALAAGISAGACPGCAQGASSPAGLSMPTEPGAAPQTAEPARQSLDAGPLADYAADGITDRFAKSDHVLIIRHAGQLYAPTAVCTHRHCVLKIKSEALACPCHGSRFTPEGIPIHGPARAPLVRYAIATDANQHVIIDRSRQFEKGDWDNPAAFIKL